jgi:signal transduction histidine kinase
VPRRVPTVLLIVGFAILLVWYVIYTQRVIAELRRETQASGQMYARVFKALSDPSEGTSTAALLDLSQHIRQLGVPVILTDLNQVPLDTANLPFRERLNSPRMRQYVRTLEAQNPPVFEPGVGFVYYGNSPLVTGLRVIPALQGILLAFLITAMIFTLRTRAHADRESVWAGMARESAHQLGTPLSSLSGWLELLRERANGDTVLDHMGSDLERLERVAHRFERIGRPPRAEPVDAGDLVQRVAGYFRARVPSLAHTVTVCASVPPGVLEVRGDTVLLEWAIEAITKNAIDALAGRGGRVDLTAERLAEGSVRLRVADDGPGVNREIRKQIFRPGFSTKARGWGIGLSLAKRIVEENHGGRLVLVPSERGAVFDIILPG